MTTHALTAEQVAELLPVYALGAVDAPERSRLESYVATHPDVENELIALRQVAALLRSDTGPSPEVWDRIANLIHSMPAAAENPTPEAAPMPVSLDERRRRRVPVRLAAVAASFALLTGVAAALTIDAGDQSPAPEPTLELSAAANAARTTVGAQQGTVTADDGASVDVVVLPSRKGYVLAVEIPRGEVYRLFATTLRGPVLVAILSDQRVPIVFDLPEGTTGLVLSDRPLSSLPAATLGPEATPPTGGPTTSDTTPNTTATTSVPATSGPGLPTPTSPEAAPAPLPPLGGLVPSTSLPPLPGLG